MAGLWTHHRFSMLKLPLWQQMLQNSEVNEFTQCEIIMFSFSGPPHQYLKSTWTITSFSNVITKSLKNIWKNFLSWTAWQEKSCIARRKEEDNLFVPTLMLHRSGTAIFRGVWWGIQTQNAFHERGIHGIFWKNSFRYLNNLASKLLLLAVQNVFNWAHS